MNLHQAQTLIEHIRDEAERDGLSVSIAAVDAGGHLVSFARMNGSSFLQGQVAIGKAFTAAAFRHTSGDVASMLDGLPAMTAILTTMSHGHLVPDPGGVPVVLDTRFVGALGISGGTHEQDAQLAERAIAAFTAS